MLLEFFPRCKKIFFLFSLLAMSCIAMAQRIVSGSIVDENQKPVSDATVMVKGTNRQTLTNQNGKFSIEAGDEDILIISHISFLALEVKATQAANISLASNAKNLSEVVVTALGVKKEAKRLGYSVQEIKGEELVKARDQNPLTGLTGKIAGLSVGPSAELLRKPVVLLRGNEINLYVVDGIPISSDTWNISPWESPVRRPAIARGEGVLPERRVASCAAQHTRSRAAPGKGKGTFLAKRALFISFRSSAAVLRVVLLAIDARRFAARFALQSRALGGGHHPIGLGARFVVVETRLSGAQTTGFRTRELAGFHTLVDAGALVRLAGVQVRRTRKGGRRRDDGEGNEKHRLLHDFLLLRDRGRRFGRLCL